MATITFDFNSFTEAGASFDEAEVQNARVNNGGSWTETGAGALVSKFAIMIQRGVYQRQSAYGDGHAGQIPPTDADLDPYHPGGQAKCWGRIDYSYTWSTTDTSYLGDNPVNYSSWMAWTRFDGVYSDSNWPGSYSVDWGQFPPELALTSDVDEILEDNSVRYTHRRTKIWTFDDGVTRYTVTSVETWAYSLNRWFYGYITDATDLYNTTPSLSSLTESKVYLMHDSGSFYNDNSMIGWAGGNPALSGLAAGMWLNDGLSSMAFAGFKCNVVARDWAIRSWFPNFPPAHIFTPITWTDPGDAVQGRCPPPGTIVYIEPVGFSARAPILLH